MLIEQLTNNYTIYENVAKERQLNLNAIHDTHINGT